MRRASGLAFGLLLVAQGGLAQVGGEISDICREIQPPAAGSEEEIVRYRVIFISRYSPNTALDMVRQIPGFQIDNGGDKRGFGGVLGNIFINDRRPSAKQDLPSAILGIRHYM